MTRREPGGETGRRPSGTVDSVRALVVLCTIDTDERANALARSLVERRLAACVQVVGPIRSTYRWRDAVESASEWLLLMKTTEARFPDLRDGVAAAHPYDVPEIVALPIESGLPEYLAWIAASTS
jgi:periplasmic divalent cation tolerance protein